MRQRVAASERVMVLRRLMVLVLAMTILSCGKGLSRDKAAKLIQEHKGFAEARVLPFQSAAFDRAVADKMWRQQDGWWAPKKLGRQLFHKITLDAVTLAAPLKRTVREVTGVTDGPQAETTKVATFKYYFSNLSEPIAKYTGITTADHEGKALLRLFDDGWRVEEIEYASSIFDGENSRPFAPTPKGEIDNEWAAEATLTRIVSIARAWEARTLDVATYALGEKMETRVRVPGADLARALSPTYVHFFPSDDGWERPLEFYVAGGGNYYEIRSLGSDGKRDDDGGGSDKFAKDIIYRDGDWDAKPDGIKPSL